MLTSALIIFHWGTNRPQVVGWPNWRILLVSILYYCSILLYVFLNNTVLRCCKTKVNLSPIKKPATRKRNWIFTLCLHGITVGWFRGAPSLLHPIAAGCSSPFPTEKEESRLQRPLSSVPCQDSSPSLDSRRGQVNRCTPEKIVVTTGDLTCTKYPKFLLFSYSKSFCPVRARKPSAVTVYLPEVVEAASLLVTLDHPSSRLQSLPATQVLQHEPWPATSSPSLPISLQEAP